MKSKIIIQASLMFLVLINTVYGYEIEKTQTGAEMSWSSSNMPVGWYLHKDAAPDFDFNTTKSALLNSFNAWQDVECSYLTFEYKGESNVTANDVGIGDPDYKNVMIWVNESEWDSSWTDAFAVTVPVFYQQTGEIIDADILFSKAFKWSVDVNGEEGKADLQSIATHEIGHLLGLDHPNNSDATMYWSALEGEIHKRTLAADDIQGICYLYYVPGKDGSSCLSSSDCEIGRSCVYHPDSGGKICSSSCQCSSDCSGDLKCIDNQCLPKEAEIGGIGSVCSTTIPCATSEMICLNTPKGSYCSSFCNTDNDCPEDWSCVELESEGGLKQYGCYTANPSSTAPNSDEIMITSFQVDPLSPSPSNEKITLSASASGDGDVEYKFSVRKVGESWEVLKEFSVMPITYWIAETNGNYELKLEVRRAEMDDCTEDESMLSYVISDEDNVDGDSSTTDGDSDGSDGISCNSANDSYSTLILMFGLLAIISRRKILQQ